MLGPIGTKGNGGNEEFDRQSARYSDSLISRVPAAQWPTHDHSPHRPRELDELHQTYRSISVSRRPLSHRPVRTLLLTHSSPGAQDRYFTARGMNAWKVAWG